MKLARFLIKVPVDDALLIDSVRDHVRKFLDGRGTEELPLATTKAEGDEGQLAGMPTVGRIHWTAVEVVKAQEHQPPAPEAAKPRTRRSNGAAAQPPG